VLGTTGAQAQPLRKLFERTSQSVVVVHTLEKTLAPEAGRGFVTAGGLGSGTIISTTGRILTAAHVVQTADRVGVEFKDGRKFTARVVASSPRADVALLQLEHPPAGLVAAPIGPSDSVATGDEVFVIGAPYGMTYTLTVGHLSGRVRPRGTIGGVPMEYLQTDAAINQGNSGGPLFDLQGRVIGVVSHILTESGGFEGLGFAVSSRVAETLLLQSGSFWTGVDGLLLTDALARMLNVPQAAGLLIQRVSAGSPGAVVGLQAGTVPVRIDDEDVILGGDIVLAVGDVELTADPATADRADRYLRNVPPGGTVRIRVLRGGQFVTLTAPKPY